MSNETILPIEWKSWDQADELVHVYYNVTFTDSFGVFFKGENLTAITVDYSKGIIEATAEDGTSVLKKQQWVGIAI
jgi:hypothetical protein